jgi:hypothetical protein
MKKSGHDQQGPITPKPAGDGYAPTDVTRRTVLTGAAAAGAAIATGAPGMALAAHPSVRDDMILFLLLSAALTGVSEPKLGLVVRGTSPPAVPQNLKLTDFPTLIRLLPDPVDVKRDYFIWLNERHPAGLERLLQLTRDSLNPAGRTRQQAIIEKVQAAGDDTNFLARSIVLMWYLGAWYDPNDLRRASKINQTVTPRTIISAKAYTQGWLWKIAQAHPMGFSEMQFGYWGEAPKLSLTDFIGMAPT